MTSALDVASVYLGTFAPQTDRYQLWRPERDRWEPVKDTQGQPVELTPQRFLEARESGTPLGVYWIGSPAHVAAMDFDAEAGWDQLRAVQGVLWDVGIHAYAELSRRGGHLWIVFDAVLPAIVLVRGLRAAVRLAGLDDTDPKIEYRPASDHVSEYGHAMRAPMTINHRTGRIEPLLDAAGNELHAKVAGMLLAIELANADRMVTLAERYVPPLVITVAEPRRPPDGTSPIERFNATWGVAAILARDWGVANATPGRAVRCPAHDDRSPSLSIARADDRAWCHSPACELHANGKGVDAFDLARLADSRTAVA